MANKKQIFEFTQKPLLDGTELVLIQNSDVPSGDYFFTSIDELSVFSESEVDEKINSSVFEPTFIYSEGLEIINVDFGEYFVSIGKSQGNLVVVDAPGSTYESIEIRITNEWSSSEIGTFRLDLVIDTNQTFLFEVGIEGVSDLDLPTTGVASLLFDKPYGSTTWYVRQVI